MRTHVSIQIEPARVQQEIRQEWAERLDVPIEDVQPDSNFFLDGGDSLTAVELVVALGERFELDVSLEPLFIHGTLQALVDSVLADADRPPA